MKLYKFYRITSKSSIENLSNPDISDKYTFYAFTIDKHIANRFIKERDMKKFIKVVSKVSKDEYFEFLKSDGNEAQLLREIEYKHTTYPSSDMNRDNVGEYSVEILSTLDEKNFVEMSDGSYLEYLDGMSRFFPFILKKKYLNHLKTLEYLSLFKFIAPMDDTVKSLMTEDELYNYGDDNDWDTPMTRCDELGLFVYYFGDTFKLS